MSDIAVDNRNSALAVYGKALRCIHVLICHSIHHQLSPAGDNFSSALGGCTDVMLQLACLQVWSLCTSLRGAEGYQDTEACQRDADRCVSAVRGACRHQGCTDQGRPEGAAGNAMRQLSLFLPLCRSRLGLERTILLHALCTSNVLHLRLYVPQARVRASHVMVEVLLKSTLLAQAPFRS